MKTILARFGVSMRDDSYERQEGGIIAFSGKLVAPRNSAFDELAEYLGTLDGWLNSPSTG